MPRVTKADLEARIKHLEETNARLMDNYIEVDNKNTVLTEEITALKTQLAEKSAKIASTRAKELSKDALIAENKRLKQELEEKDRKIAELLTKPKNEPVHNARGAGRKPKLPEWQRELIRIEYATGDTTIRALANKYEISIGMVQRILKEKGHKAQNETKNAKIGNDG